MLYSYMLVGAGGETVCKFRDYANYQGKGENSCDPLCVA